VLVLKKGSGAPQPVSDGKIDQNAVTVIVTSHMSDTTSIPIAVSAGSAFTITIPSNHTTGYQWRMADSLSEETLRSSGSTYNDPANGIPGQGGTETWTFQAVGKGKATFKLEYVQPWEKSVPPARTQVFTVTVD